MVVSSHGLELLVLDRLLESATKMLSRNTAKLSEKDLTLEFFGW